MSQNGWYIAIDGQREGPMSKEQLMARLDAGDIDDNTLAFVGGMKNWTAIRDLPELNNDGGATAPPPPRASGTLNSHVIDYKIYGNEMQFVEVELDPDETVIAEAGAMIFMEEGIEMETRFGDGSEPDKGLMGKVFAGVKRKFTGESLFMTWFTHKGRGKSHVSFGAPYPGKIIPIDLSTIGGELICQKDSFLCAAMGTKVGVAFNRKIGTALFGGEGLIMQRLEGDGMAFVHAGGTIVERDLKPGETMRIDTGCVVGYTGQVNFDVQMVKGFKSMIFGGEGLFLATLTGPGKIWLQSLPFSRLAERIFAAAPQTGGSRKGEGGLLDNIGIGNLLDGD